MSRSGQYRLQCLVHRVGRHRELRAADVLDVVLHEARLRDGLGPGRVEGVEAGCLHRRHKVDGGERGRVGAVRVRAARLHKGARVRRQLRGLVCARSNHRSEAVQAVAH
jgi:hypothetical protein